MIIIIMRNYFIDLWKKIRILKNEEYESNFNGSMKKNNNDQILFEQFIRNFKF